LICIYFFISNIRGPEPFSYEEIYTYQGREPLVDVDADLNNVPWYHQEVYPLVYQGYPINSSIQLSSGNRDPGLN